MSHVTYTSHVSAIVSQSLHICHINALFIIILYICVWVCVCVCDKYISFRSLLKKALDRSVETLGLSIVTSRLLS